MATLVLSGDLKKFGDRFTYTANTPRDLVYGVARQVKGLRARILAGNFKLRKLMHKGRASLNLNDLAAPIAADDVFVLQPIAHGAGGGRGKIIAGVALLAAAVVFAPAVATVATQGMSAEAAAFAGSMSAEVAFGVTFSQVAGLGAMMILAGAYQMFMTSKTTTASAASDNASWIFSGVKNTTTQGAAKPLVYGEFICGSVVISSDLSAERV